MRQHRLFRQVQRLLLVAAILTAWRDTVIAADSWHWDCSFIRSLHGHGVWEAVPVGQTRIIDGVRWTHSTRDSAVRCTKEPGTTKKVVERENARRRQNEERRKRDMLAARAAREREDQIKHEREQAENREYQQRQQQLETTLRRQGRLKDDEPSAPKSESGD